MGRGTFDMTYGGDGESTGEGQVGPKWWKKSERSNLTQNVWATVDHLLHRQEHYEAIYVHLLRMYSQRMASAYYAQDFSISIDPGHIIRMNAIKSCVDTSMAQIGAERARPMHLVSGGDQELAKRAQRLDKFTLGAFIDCDYYPLTIDEFRDGNIWGRGWNKWYTQDGKIKCERVPSPEMVFDDNECRLGKPRSLYQIKDVDPDTLTAKFGKGKRDLRARIQGSKLLREGMYDYGLAKNVTAIEAVHLPSGLGSGDGLHTITTSDGVVFEEEWKHDFFPWDGWDWNPAPFGLLGLGMVEDLTSMQVEMNFTAQKIQKIFNLAASIAWVEKGSNIGRMNNREVQVREYKGKPPFIQQMGSVSGEFFGHLDRLYARCFEQAGISQMSAQGSKPPGVESGEGMRVLYDIGNRRFRHVQQRWADFHVRAGKQVERCANDLLANGTDLVLVGPGQDYAEKLKYSDVKIDEGSYLVKRFPVALLPDEPAGKIEMVSKIMQMVGPEQAPALMGLLSGIPDVESYVDLMKAPYDAAVTTVQRILATGEYEPPRPQMNLGLLRDLATKELNRSFTMEGVPVEKQDALSRFIDDIGFMEDQMQADAQAKAVEQAAVESSLSGAGTGASPEAQALPLGPQQGPPQGMPPGMPPM